MHKASRQFFSRNTPRQKRVAWFIPVAEWGNMQSRIKNNLCSKAIIRNRRTDKGFPRQIKVKGIHNQWTRLTRYIKGESEWKGIAIRVRKLGSTKAVKISISVKISQKTHKIKRCNVWHHIPKTCTVGGRGVKNGFKLKRSLT